TTSDGVLTTPPLLPAASQRPCLVTTPGRRRVGANALDGVNRVEVHRVDHRVVIAPSEPPYGMALDQPRDGLDDGATTQAGFARQTSEAHLRLRLLIGMGGKRVQHG